MSQSVSVNTVSSNIVDGLTQGRDLGCTQILTDTLGHVVGGRVDSRHPGGALFTHGLLCWVPHRERVRVVLSSRTVHAHIHHRIILLPGAAVN